MSSTYRAICLGLGHTPALLVDDDLRHDSAEAALQQARQGPHRGCTSMVGRWSGALVEVGCPPHETHPRHTHWVEAVWLHIAAEALVADTPALQPVLRRLPPCFHAERLLRLRGLLAEHAPGVIGQEIRQETGR